MDYISDVFATGARDGMVMIWDYRSSQQSTATLKPDNMILNAHCQSGITVTTFSKKTSYLLGKPLHVIEELNP